MYAIETEGLTKRYNDLVAVNSLDLKVREGEIFGLLGPNGAGKTTTLLMLTTLIPPTSGIATVNNFNVARQPDKVRESIGIVFQEFSSDEMLTGYENLKLHGWLYNMPSRLMEERIKEVLVSPVSRTSIFIGKVLGGSTETAIQVAILLFIGFSLSTIGAMKELTLNPASVIISCAFLFMTTAGAVSIGLIIGSQMESPEGYELIISFVIFPLFFPSGALFPINNLPPWLAPFTLMDPATYTVDGLRGALLGTSTFPLILDFTAITLFTAATIVVGQYAFKKMKV